MGSKCTSAPRIKCFKKYSSARSYEKPSYCSYVFLDIMPKIFRWPTHNQLPYNNEYSLWSILTIASLLLRISTMFSVFSMQRNTFHTRKMWLEVYNLFSKEETYLEIYLDHIILLKTLRVLDVHQLVKHCNLLSTILPPNQLPHDWEAFPCIVLSHRSTDCQMYNYLKLKEQIKKRGCTYRKLVEPKI